MYVPLTFEGLRDFIKMQLYKLDLGGLSSERKDMIDGLALINGAQKALEILPGDKKKLFITTEKPRGVKAVEVCLRRD